jgi:hypothetical protein
MNSISLCILACGRNIEPYIEKVLENFSTIQSWCKETKIVIFENDSEDKTAEILQGWSNGTTKILLTEENLITRIPIREYRLAYIRNRLLETIPSTYDYFMMVDIDDVFIHPVKKESFESCFTLSDWDIITANSYEKYYDIYALRIPNIIDYNCWKKIEECIHIYKWIPANAIERHVTYFENFMSNIQTPLYVESAFNIAILGKVQSIHPCCKYASGTTFIQKKQLFGIMKKSFPIHECEHILFHKCIRSHGGKILFNPNFKL